MQKFLALLYNRFNIGKDPIENKLIKSIINYNVDNFPSKKYVDNIIYWGGPENIVRVLFKYHGETTPPMPSNVRVKLPEAYKGINPVEILDIPLKEVSHYDIAAFFNYIYLNRAHVESHDGFDTNISIYGEPTSVGDKYPHPYIVKIKHDSGICWVRAVRCKIFGIDII